MIENGDYTTLNMDSEAHDLNSDKTATVWHAMYHALKGLCDFNRI